MFTGIVRHIGVVRRVSGGAGGKRLAIDIGPLAEDLGEGDSLAVQGTCLTVSAIHTPEAEFDVMGETLSKTTLGSLRVGSKVNLELPLTPTDALDGHLVQGHVDGIAEVRTVRTGPTHLIEFAASGDLTDQMVLKGSICIDGVSLTLADAGDGKFSVALIPETLTRSTLGDLTTGSKVNVETDIIGKFVLKHLRNLARRAGGGGLTLEKLNEAGFG